MIAVRSWERAKGLTRIEFVAGMRALADYRRANKSAREIAGLFSTGRDDAPAVAAHMMEENKELHRRVRVLEEIAAGVEAQTLYDETKPSAEGTRLVVKIFDGKEIDSLKKIAHSLMSNPQTISLLAARDKETVRLVFARSTDAPGDMPTLLHRALETYRLPRDSHRRRGCHRIYKLYKSTHEQ